MMKVGVCRHMLASVLMTVVVPLIFPLGLPCKVNSLKPGDPRSAIHVDCGTSEDSLINITFTGEAFNVYSVENELGCTAERINIVKFRFVGINKRPCGVKWIEKMKTLVVKLQVQKYAVIMKEDILYDINCIYGKTAEGQAIVGVTDGRSQIAADEMAPGDTGLDDEPSSIPGGEYFTLKVLDQRMHSRNVFLSTDHIKVQIEMKNPSADVDVVVTECLFLDSSKKKLFQRKFLYHGCGDGVVLKTSQKFNVVKKGYKMESPKLPVSLLQGQGPVLIKCFISTCIPATACVVTCPSDSNIEDSITDHVEGRFVIISGIILVNVSQEGHCKPVQALPPSLPSTTVLPFEKPASFISTKITTNTGITETSVTKTTTAEPPVTAVPLKYISDFNNPEILPYVIVVFILSFSVGILILVVIYMSMKFKNHHKKGSSRFPRSYSTYQSSKHPSKSNLLHTVFLTPTSSESGSRSGDETRYNGNNYMKRHPVSRSDSFERRRSLTEETRPYIPKISRSGSDIRERVHTFPEESYPRRTKSEPKRSRSNIHEREFSPTRFGDLDRRCTSIPRAHYSRHKSPQETGNRRDSSSMQRWEGEPRPDYRRSESYKKGWEVMEPILEELQSSDLHTRGHQTKL